MSLLPDDFDLHVLIADDDEKIRRVMRKVLEDHDVRVHEAANGTEAVKLLAEREPDMVLMDSMLPRRPGLDCLRAIRNNPRFYKTPVVMCSARTNLDYVRTCMQAGANGFLKKPFTITKLLTTIDNLFPQAHVLGRRGGLPPRLAPGQADPR